VPTAPAFSPSTKAWALRRVGQVALATARERTRGRRTLSARDVPSSPWDIDALWLTDVLCAGTPGTRVATVRRLGASRGTTTREALEVLYDGAGASAGLPTHLFVKCTTALAQRLMLGLGGLLEGEPGFYTRIRPSLSIEAPIGYFGAVDPVSWRSVVLIEDVVRTRGAMFWTPSMQTTAARIRGLLGNMAAWHGPLWDSHRLAEWGWLKTPADQMRLIDALIGMADRTTAGLRRARAVIPPTVRARHGDLYSAMRRSMESLSQGPPTYLHGDLHIANTYLTRENGIGVCDWQVGLRGSWAYDYAYLVATALEVADRRAWEADLLDYYLERLCAAGGGPLRRADAWMAYRRALFYPYFAWLYTIGRSRLQPSFQPVQVSLTMLERLGTAIADLDSFGAVGL
jgi:hypothetical protein